MKPAFGDPGWFRSGLVWRGAGRAAFAGFAGAAGGPGALPGSAQPRWVADARELHAPSGEEGALSSQRVLGEFFGAGGRGAYLVTEPRVGAEGWVGDPGMPGQKSGIYALADLEDVSTLVLPGTLSALGRERVLELAVRRPDLFFFLDHSGGLGGRGGRLDGAGAGRASPGGGLPAISLKFLSAAVVEVHGPLSAGALVGHLERLDFQMEPSWGAGQKSDPPFRLDPGELSRLEGWRRREGLRRSIDWGTRWLVYDVHHPLIWRRAEREVKGFLYRLARAGLIRGSPGRLDFVVSCEPGAASLTATAQQAAREPSGGEQAARPGGGSGSERGRERGEVQSVVVRVRAVLEPAHGRGAGRRSEVQGLEFHEECL